MITTETEAITVKITPYGEDNIIVNFATHNRGKITAMAIHGRKSFKRFSGSLDYFVNSRIKISKKGNERLWRLEEAKVTKWWKNIVVNPLKYMAGMWSCELYSNYTPLEFGEPETFLWLKNGLDFFDQNEPDILSLTYIFINLLKLTGNLPSFDRCVSCGKKAPASKSAFFHPEAGGIVCRICGGRRNKVPAEIRTILTTCANINKEGKIIAKRLSAKNEHLLLEVMTWITNCNLSKKLPAMEMLFNTLKTLKERHL